MAALKNITIVILSISLVKFVESRTCDKRNPCPKNWKCMVTREARSGVCKYDTIHKGIDYNEAARVFSSLDVSHSRTISFSDAYKGLHILVPGASEQMISKLTKNGDKNRNGKIDYSEFVAMYRALVDELQSRGMSWNKCYNSPCRKNQMCRNCRNSKGYCCDEISTVPAKTTGPTGELTQSERAQVNNIFTALNTNKDKGVSAEEFYALLVAVQKTTGDKKLYEEVYKYILARGNTNNDGILNYSEFLRACRTLKAKDPKRFPLFLKTAERLKKLKIGDPCVRYGSNAKPCPKGSSCQRIRVLMEIRNSKPPRTYPAYRYFCTAVTTTKKPVYNLKAGQQCSYGICGSGCRRCASGLVCRRKAYHYGEAGASIGICTPTNCKACTLAHGTWMKKSCTFGETVADGIMFTHPLQCEQHDAASKAKCYRYNNKDCRACVSENIDRRLGPLCGWSSVGGSHSGSNFCQPNNGGDVIPLIVSTKQCPRVMIVHGRE